jgi:hypothetical protein
MQRLTGDVAWEPQFLEERNVQVVRSCSNGSRTTGWTCSDDHNVKCQDFQAAPMMSQGAGTGCPALVGQPAHSNLRLGYVYVPMTRSVTCGVTQSLPNHVASIHSMSRSCPGRSSPVIDWVSMSRTSPLASRALEIVDIRI